MSSDLEELQILRTSWIRSLRADGKSENTIRTYARSVQAFIDFLADPPGAESVSPGEEPPLVLLARLPVRDETDLRRDHIEAWVGQLHKTATRHTVINRFSGVHVWLEWMVTRPDIPVDYHPMTGMRRPSQPEDPPQFLSHDELRALLATCNRREYLGVRDYAMLRLFIDTGIRIEEMRGLMLPDVIDGRRVPTVDLDTQTIYVIGKGRRARTVAFGHKTAEALDAYLRWRRRHPAKHLPDFWLPEPRFRKGLAKMGMTDSGIRRMVQRRCKQASVRHVNPHLFRHTWADAQKRRGLDRGDMKNQGGWRSDKVMDRYGAWAETDRALAAHRKRSFGDDI